MIPPPTPSLVRVDTLPLTEIAAYLSSYNGRCSAHTARTVPVAVNDEDIIELDLPKLNKCYYSNQLLDARDYDRRHVRMLIGWTQLRRFNADAVIMPTRWTKENSIIATFRRARTFLIQNQARLLFASHTKVEPWEKEAMKIVEACMRILCEISSIGVKEASAMVAAWHPTGIYMSDELVKSLFGEDVQPMEDWTFFRKFYKEALKAFEVMYTKGGVTSGRDMEKVAWSMYHAYKNSTSICPAEQSTGSSKTRQPETNDKEPEHELEHGQRQESCNGHQKGCQEQEPAKNQDENQASGKDEALAKDQTRDADEDLGQDRQPVEGATKLVDPSLSSSAASSTAKQTDNEEASSSNATLPSGGAVQEQDIEATVPAIARLCIIEQSQANATSSDLASLKPTLLSDGADVGFSSRLASEQPTDEVTNNVRASTPPAPHASAPDSRKARKHKTKSKGSGSKSRSRHSSNINLTIRVAEGSAPPIVHIHVSSADSMPRDKKRKRSKGKAKEIAGEGAEEGEEGRKRSRRNNDQQEPGTSSQARSDQPRKKPSPRLQNVTP